MTNLLGRYYYFPFTYEKLVLKEAKLMSQDNTTKRTKLELPSCEFTTKSDN